MAVFSGQGFDLRHFRGRFCEHLGTYAAMPAIAAAQAKLKREILHEDQIVWCSLDRPDVVPLEEPIYLHTIEPGDGDVLAILNGFVWEHIIGNTRCIPLDVHRNMRFACCQGDERFRQKRLREMEDRYLAERLPLDLWSQVISDNLECPLPVLLLKWPFIESRILDVEEIVLRTNGSTVPTEGTHAPQWSCDPKRCSDLSSVNGCLHKHNQNIA